MTAREYRVTKAGRRHPDLRELVTTFRDDDPGWQNWEPNDEDFEQGDKDGIDYRGLSGVLGIVEATAREEEAKGGMGLQIEVREVGSWTNVRRGSDSIENDEEAERRVDARRRRGPWPSAELCATFAGQGANPQDERRVVSEIVARIRHSADVTDWTAVSRTARTLNQIALIIEYEFGAARPSGAQAAQDERARVVALQSAVDRAHAAMHGSEYVGGPTEREAWRTAFGALSEVVTQHIGQTDAAGAPERKAE